MRVAVKIRFNSASGQFEQFLVESEGAPVPGGTHDDDHEEMARLIGSAIEASPELEEVVVGLGAEANAEQVIAAGRLAAEQQTDGVAASEAIHEGGASG